MHILALFDDIFGKISDILAQIRQYLVKMSELFTQIRYLYAKICLFLARKSKFSFILTKSCLIWAKMLLILPKMSSNKAHICVKWTKKWSLVKNRFRVCTGTPLKFLIFWNDEKIKNRPESAGCGRNRRKFICDDILRWFDVFW